MFPKILFRVALWNFAPNRWRIVVKFFAVLWIGVILAGLTGCESSSSITAPASRTDDKVEAKQPTEETAANNTESQKETSVFAREAEAKYRLATQLLAFSGPIDDLSTESKNVRLLAADLLHSAIQLNPSEFKYYRDLFMTYMVLQEPVLAMEAIEPAQKTPALAKEVVEFQNLVFGALQYASMIDPDN